MKKLLTILLVFGLSTSILGQTYKYKRTFTKTTEFQSLVKLKGTIIITDTIIEIKSKYGDAKFDVKKISDNKSQTIYKILGQSNKQYKISIILNKFKYSKKEPLFLALKTIDTFLKNESYHIYPLIPLK